MRFSPVVNAEPEQTDVRIVLDPNGAREEPPAVMPPAEEGKKPTEPEAKAAAPAEPPALRTVLGKVVDPNGKPVAGAHVMLYLVNYKAIPRSQERLQSIETDQEGRFRFMPVVSIRSSQEWREYNVIVTALGKATASVFEISRPGHRPDNLEISMPEAGSLRGKITGPDGRPIAGAQVSAASPLHPPVDGIRATRSNANGDFEISDLKKENVSQPLSVPGKPGAFTTTFGSLHVQHPGFAWTAVSYNEVPSTLNVILRPAAVIEGRVINGETGEPVAGVVVEARGTPLFRSPSPYAITDSQGRYRLESLNANQYVIWAEKEGWTVHGVEGFNIDVGQTKTAPDLRLIRGQLIVGQVIDVDTGRPIRPLEDDRLHSEFDRPQVCLEICPWRQTFLGAHQFTAVREDGSFQVRVAPGMNWIRLLMPQSWEVLGSPPGTLQRETHRVNVVDGKDANVQFRVRRKAAVPLETAVGP
jgi:protocatechuate 3,4-dioxygenase beta subunit